jgi:hypothetical protein
MSYYLYCNSGATGRQPKRIIKTSGEKDRLKFDIDIELPQDTKGFVIGYPKGQNPCKKEKGKVYHSVQTTTEFAFAKEFETRKEAEAFNNKYKLPCIIFERVN